MPRWSAASRRILVDEPSVEATIAILRGLQEKYELHHGVDITDPAIVAAAELSHRYITDRFLPDKAIDLIDEAAPRSRSRSTPSRKSMDKLDRRLIQLKIEREAVKQEKDEASQKRLQLIEEEIEQLEREYADLEEIWTAEKVAAQGGRSSRRKSTKVRLQIGSGTREGKLAEGVRAASTASLPNSKPRCKCRNKAGAAGAQPRSPSWCAPRSAPRKSPRSWRAPPASRSRA